MKKILLLISILFLGGTSVAFAAPILRYDRTIIPETHNLYDLGTTSQAWRNLHVASSTYSGNFVATSTTATSTFAGGVTANQLDFSNTANGIFFYNTADQVTNWERATMDWNSNIFEIRTNAGGSGTGRALRFTQGISSLVQATLSGSVALTGGLWEIARTTSGTNYNQTAITGTNTASSGMTNGYADLRVINQSGTAGYTGILIQPTETSTGSGNKRLIDAGTVATPSTFVVTNTGFTGIGTSSPSALLTVSGSNSGTTLTSFQSNPNISIVNTNGGANTFSPIDFRGKNSVGTEISTSMISGIHTDLTSASEDGAIAFHGMTAGTFAEWGRFVGGSLGVGTTTPYGALAIVTSGSTSAAPPAINIGYGTPGSGNDRNYNIDVHQIITAGSAAWCNTQRNNGVLYSNIHCFYFGNTGINTTLPYSQLQVTGGGTGIGQTFAVVNSASTTLMQIRDNGNTAIGSSTPIANFQATTPSANATTSIQLGKPNQNKGTCLTYYDSAGTPVYAYIPAGTTAFTLTSTQLSGCQN